MQLPPQVWHRQTAAWADVLGVSAARYQTLYGLSPSTWIFWAIVTSVVCVLPVVSGATSVRRHGADAGGSGKEDAGRGLGHGQRSAVKQQRATDPVSERARRRTAAR